MPTDDAIRAAAYEHLYVARGERDGRVVVRGHDAAYRAVGCDPRDCIGDNPVGLHVGQVISECADVLRAHARAAAGR